MIKKSLILSLIFAGATFFVCDAQQILMHDNRPEIRYGIRPDIGLSEESSKQVAQLLHDILANEYVLYTKTFNYHWNLKGSDFYALHTFFKEIYEQLLDIVDKIAERVQSIGGTAYGTLQEFAESATIKENPADARQKTQMAMIEQLKFGQFHINIS